MAGELGPEQDDGSKWRADGVELPAAPDEEVSAEPLLDAQPQPVSEEAARELVQKALSPLVDGITPRVPIVEADEPEEEPVPDGTMPPRFRRGPRVWSKIPAERARLLNWLNKVVLAAGAQLKADQARESVVNKEQPESHNGVLYSRDAQIIMGEFLDPEHVVPGDSPALTDRTPEAFNQLLQELTENGIINDKPAAVLGLNRNVRTVHGLPTRVSIYSMTDHPDAALVVRRDPLRVKEHLKGWLPASKEYQPVAVSVVRTKKGAAFETKGDNLQPSKGLLEVIAASRINKAPVSPRVGPVVGEIPSSPITARVPSEEEIEEESRWAEEDLLADIDLQAEKMRARGETKQAEPEAAAPKEDIIDAEIVEEPEALAIEAAQPVSADVPAPAEDIVDAEEVVEGSEAPSAPVVEVAPAAEVVPVVPEIPSSGRVFEMGPGPTRPEAVPLTPEAAKEPRRFKKEYSLQDKPEDGSFSVFSDLVHEVQQDNEKFGIPTSGQLTKDQVLKLADSATTIEQLDALAGEYLHRADKLRKDKQLFEKRQPGKAYEPQQVGKPIAENNMLGVYIERRKVMLRNEARAEKRKAGKRKTAAAQAGRVFDQDDAWEDSQDILRSSSENLHDRQGPNVPRIRTAESGDEDVRARANQGALKTTAVEETKVEVATAPLPEYSRYGDEMAPGTDRTTFSELVDKADIAVTREGQLSDEQVAALAAVAESTDDVEAIMQELAKRGEHSDADNEILNERYEALEKLEQIEDDYHEDDDLSDGGGDEPEPDIDALLNKLESNFSEKPVAVTPEQPSQRVDTEPAKLIDQLGSTYSTSGDSAAQVRRRGSILAAAIKAGYARPSAQGFLGVAAPRVETEQSRAFMAGLEDLKARVEAEAEPAES